MKSKKLVECEREITKHIKEIVTSPIGMRTRLDELDKQIEDLKMFSIKEFIRLNNIEIEKIQKK